MIVAILTIDVAIFDARTLKEKRSVIKSLKQKLRNRFNVSVAEVAYHDTPKRCHLGIAMVSVEARAMHAQLDKMVDMVRGMGGLTLVDYTREFL